MTKIEYLNLKIANCKDSNNFYPNKLFKYRKFDAFTYESIRDNYIYLCPAFELDDETECTTEVNESDYVDLSRGFIKKKAVETIVYKVCEHSKSCTYESVMNILRVCMRPDGSIRLNYLMDVIPEIQEEYPDVNTVDLVNLIANIQDLLNIDNYINDFYHFFDLCIHAREFIGVGSLTTSNEIDYMWENYSDNYSGYCIEYDFSDSSYAERLFPVIYEEPSERNNNIVMNLFNDFLSSFIEQVSHGEKIQDKSHMIRLILTKYKKWAYQDEWRIIGDPREHFPAPKIKRIYIGHNAKKEDKEKMIQLCKEKNIEYEIN